MINIVTHVIMNDIPLIIMEIFTLIQRVCSIDQHCYTSDHYGYHPLVSGVSYLSVVGISKDVCVNSWIVFVIISDISVSKKGITPEYA